MKYLVSTEEMKECDRNTIDVLGMDEMVLIERAALKARNYIGKDIRRVLIYCGSGNNGADGYALARLLTIDHIRADVVDAGKGHTYSESNRRQAKIAANYGVETVTNPLPVDYDLLVDAILGVGLKKPVDTTICNMIQEMNHSGVPIISLDIPSGIGSQDGHIYGNAVKARLTVTFAFAKRGLYLDEGLKHAGIIKVEDVGITKDGFQGDYPSYFMPEIKDLPNILSPRDPSGHKGTFGKVLLFAGNHAMCGACVLAAQSILRSGAGMLRVLTSRENASLLQSMLPEAILDVYDDLKVDKQSLIKDALNWADVLAMGPGIGTGDEALCLVELLLKECSLSTHYLIMDADALNLLALHENLRELVCQRNLGVNVITPHIAEFARLAGKNVSECLKDRLPELEKLSASLNAFVVQKSDVTAIFGHGRGYVIAQGSDALSTAGSGDTLLGIIAGILAQEARFKKTNTYDHLGDVIACGVLIHAHAGKKAGETVGRDAVIAGDISMEMQKLLKEIRDIQDIEGWVK